MAAAATIPRKHEGVDPASSREDQSRWREDITADPGQSGKGVPQISLKYGSKFPKGLLPHRHDKNVPSSAGAERASDQEIPPYKALVDLIGQCLPRLANARRISRMVGWSGTRSTHEDCCAEEAVVSAYHLRRGDNGLRRKAWHETHYKQFFLRTTVSCT